MLSVLPLLALALAAADAPRTLPTRFVADRVYVTPQTTTGATLSHYTDTGGGLFLTEQAVKRLGLATKDAPAENGQPAQQSVTMPAFTSGASIPPPAQNDGALFVMPEAMQKTQGGFDADGMLGEAWFGGHVWTWDYPAQHLTLESAGWRPDPKATRVALGFKTENGARAGNFARLAIRVDGKALDVLFDTGAMTELEPAALAALGGPDGQRATSFIVASQFDTWHAAHPEWRVLEKAEKRTHMDMIEVPAVDVGGARVGPVWFTRRPDKNFHEFMSSMMDGRVEGALGGNALRHFRVTLYYPGAAAYFRCTRECQH